MSAESPKELAKYLLLRRGMLTSNVAEAGGFGWSRPGLDAPDLQWLFAPVVFEQAGAKEPSFHAVTLGAYLLTPDSRGTITLASADPTWAPTIEPSYFEADDDLERLVSGLKQLRELARTAPLAQHLGDPYLLRGDESDEELREHVRQTFETIYHPVGTARMGVDAGAVVDPRAARARGGRTAGGRRVGDADGAAGQHQRPGDHGRGEGRRPAARASRRAPPADAHRGLTGVPGGHRAPGGGRGAADLDSEGDRRARPRPAHGSHRARGRPGTAARAAARARRAGLGRRRARGSSAGARPPASDLDGEDALRRRRQAWWSGLVAGSVVHDEVTLPGTGLVAFGSFAFDGARRHLGAGGARGGRRPPGRHLVGDHDRRRRGHPPAARPPLPTSDRPVGWPSPTAR